MTLKDYKKKSGLTYRDIQRHVDFHFSMAYQIINYPEFYSLKKILQVASVVNMPADEATKHWQERKTKFEVEKIRKKAKG